MRSISSSFRSSHANDSSHDLKQHYRSPSPPPPIPPRSSISSLSFSEPTTTTSSDCDSVPRLIYSVGSASFDENDSISTWSTSKSATPSKQQRSSSTKTSAMRAIRMLFGSAIIRPVTIITKQDQKIREAQQQQQPIPSSRQHYNNRHKRWSQISSSDTVTTTTTSARSECFVDGDDDDTNQQCHLINSRRLSGSGIPLLFIPTTSLGLNTSKFWEEVHSKNEQQDEVFLSSTYGPISPLHVDTTTTPQGIEDTTEATSARSKDALSTTSSSYFSARSSYSSDSSLRCLSSQGVSDPKQHRSDDTADMVQEEENEEYRHASIYESNNNNNNNEKSTTTTTATTGPHPMRSTLLSKAMLLADNNSTPPAPNYHSVGTIGIGNLSSVLSKQWMLHSMRAIRPSSSSNNHHRAPIPAMLQQSSTERPMVKSVTAPLFHAIY